MTFAKLKTLLADYAKSAAFFACNRALWTALSVVAASGGATSALAKTNELWHNMRCLISENPGATMMTATFFITFFAVLSLLMYGRSLYARHDQYKAEERCRQLEAQLRSPQAEVAAKSAQLRGMILDDAIAAKNGMAQKAKEAERRRQEAAYAGLSPQLRKMVDELSAKCLAELNKRTA